MSKAKRKYRTARIASYILTAVGQMLQAKSEQGKKAPLYTSIYCARAILKYSLAVNVSGQIYARLDRGKTKPPSQLT